MNTLTQGTQTGTLGLLDEKTKAIFGQVFKTLIQIFPAWKAAVYGDVSTWAKGYKKQLVLAFLDEKINTIEQLNNGFKFARKNGGAFLPNPGVFAAWCREPTVPYHKDFNDPDPKELLEYKNADPAIRKTHMQKMRECLK